MFHTVCHSTKCLYIPISLPIQVCRFMKLKTLAPVWSVLLIFAYFYSVFVLERFCWFLPVFAPGLKMQLVGSTLSLPESKSNQVYRGGGRQIHFPCSFSHQVAKFSLIFPKLTAYVYIGLPTWLKLSMSMHACTAHKFVHASFLCFISRIGNFEKMPVTPLKRLKMTWLSKAGKFLGGFGMVGFLNFFDLVQYFFRK